ncbi:MAG: hypothetical protein JNL74_07560 [Fibrobacteres bacterium]|nr:hypothetical protein [Fibrobacterota bacterium]
MLNRFSKPILITLLLTALSFAEDVTLPINVSLIPSLSVNGKNSDSAKNFFNYSVLYSRSNKLHGLGLGLIQRTTSEMIGLQSGLLNIASGSMYGAQVGLLNIAKNGGGLSVGLVNVVGENIIPIGLINSFRNGNTNVDLWYEARTSNINLSLRKGVKSVYYLWNIASAPSSPEGPGFSYLMGPGKSIRINEKISLSQDLLFGCGYYRIRAEIVDTSYNIRTKIDGEPIDTFAVHITPTDQFFTLLFKTRTNFNWQIAKYLGLELGLSFNKSIVVVNHKPDAEIFGYNGGKTNREYLKLISSVLPNVESPGTAFWLDYHVGIKLF